jgi:hypothetical protein
MTLARVRVPIGEDAGRCPAGRRAQTAHRRRHNVRCGEQLCGRLTSRAHMDVRVVARVLISTVVTTVVGLATTGGRIASVAATQFVPCSGARQLVACPRRRVITGRGQHRTACPDSSRCVDIRWLNIIQLPRAHDALSACSWRSSVVASAVGRASRISVSGACCVNSASLSVRQGCDHRARANSDRGQERRELLVAVAPPLEMLESVHARQRRPHAVAAAPR